MVRHSLPEMEQKILDLKERLFEELTQLEVMFKFIYLKSFKQTSSKLTFMALSRMHWQCVLYIIIRVSTWRIKNLVTRLETVTKSTTLTGILYIVGGNYIITCAIPFYRKRFISKPFLWKCFLAGEDAGRWGSLGAAFQF